jgi:hypothetical protein
LPTPLSDVDDGHVRHGEKDEDDDKREALETKAKEKKNKEKLKNLSTLY